MKRVFKFLGFTVVMVVLLVAAVAIAAQLLSERKTHRKVDIKIAAPAIDNASLKQGKYLFESRGCMECHGAGGQGRELINDPNGLYVRTPNITTGTTGTVKTYSDVDWVRAIRHGIKPNGEPLLIMPSEDYSRLTDADTASLIAYLRSLPPADGEPGVIRFPLIVKALYAFGAIKDAAEKIDHAQPASVPVTVAATVEHGAYVANMCIGCHGPTLSGGKIPGGPPTWPPAANLTSGSGSKMPIYDTAEKFVVMMRTAKRPDGSEVSKVMPFDSLKRLTDVDLQALHIYLKTLQPRDAGNR
ncbi:MAG TPA: cytochrome c [Burkholderiales bacterium]|nr:cytochrome c [Burkholderiales bacterium]